MGVLEVETFCCGSLSLESGCKMIALTTFVYSLALYGLSVSNESIKEAHTAYLLLIVTIILLYGILQRVKLMLMLYLLLRGFGLVYVLVEVMRNLAGMNAINEQRMLIVALETGDLVMTLYFWMVVFSFYRKMDAIDAQLRYFDQPHPSSVIHNPFADLPTYPTSTSANSIKPPPPSYEEPWSRHGSIQRLSKAPPVPSNPEPPQGMHTGSRQRLSGSSLSLAAPSSASTTPMSELRGVRSHRATSIVGVPVQPQQQLDEVLKIHRGSIASTAGSLRLSPKPQFPHHPQTPPHSPTFPAPGEVHHPKTTTTVPTTTESPITLRAISSPSLTARGKNPFFEKM